MRADARSTPQERAVNELRSRASVLIASAAVATSFFGARAFGDGHSTLWTWVAVIAFATVAGCVPAVLWPRSDWSFNASASDVIAQYIEPTPVPVAQIHRDLALHRAAAYDDNARQLLRLFTVFRIGLAVLVIETAAWIVALAEAG